MHEVILEGVTHSSYEDSLDQDILCVASGIITDSFLQLVSAFHCAHYRLGISLRSTLP